MWTKTGSRRAWSGDLRSGGHLMCGGKLEHRAQCTLGTEDRKWNTPLWRYPPLWARSPHAPLVCCCWQGARLIMCSLLQPRRARESGRGAAGWLPRPAGSPGPNTALMRAGGADGHTRGARDYCPGPRGARERDLRRGGEETPAGPPAADLYSCSHCASMRPIWHRCFVLMMDSHGLEYQSRAACRCMYIWYYICTEPRIMLAYR